MKKEKYDRSELEVIDFMTEDVLMTSGYEGWNPYDQGEGSGEGYEGWNPH